MKKQILTSPLRQVEKIPSMIPGFDEISHGGIPKERVTLILGITGSGKTVFICQFLYKGITELSENGVFVTFEEAPVDIMKNMKGFGWDVKKSIDEDKWAFVDASPGDVEEVTSGRYDLEGLLARVKYAIKKVEAKRVGIDSMSAIFSRYQNRATIRRDLHRLISELKQMGITTLIAAEKSTEDLETIQTGEEESVSDNVVFLHNRLTKRRQMDRTVEILKFRGTTHDSEEAPLIITKEGIIIYPPPKPRLRGKGFSQRISTGIKGLDEMLYGGVYKNSVTLVNGASGTGKTILAMHFIIESAMNGEKSLLVEFEESSDQLFRNADSFNWDLRGYVKKIPYLLSVITLKS